MKKKLKIYFTTLFKKLVFGDKKKKRFNNNKNTIFQNNVFS